MPCCESVTVEAWRNCRLNSHGGASCASSTDSAMSRKSRGEVPCGCSLMPAVSRAQCHFESPIPVARWGQLLCPENDVVEYRAASPGYFGVMRTPILLGRGFLESDAATSEPVVVVNQTLARACWGSNNPVGQQLLFGRALGDNFSRPLQVVGVIVDAREFAANVPVPPMMFVPQAQVPAAINELLYQSFPLLSALVVRTSGPVEIGTQLQRAVWAVDPQEALASVAPMSQMVSDSTTFLQFLMLLMTVFAGLALLLAAVGLYGLISYYVNQRTRDIGVRMALGATQRDVLSQVLGEGLILVAVGGAVGLVGALMTTRVLKSLLFGISATDPAALAAATLLLVVVVIAATYVPARRATKVDPMVALRYE